LGQFCHVVYPIGKAGGLQILRCQGFAVVHYSLRLRSSYAAQVTLSAFRNEVEIPSPGGSEALRLLQRQA
jgi:hypothetical protein